MQIRKRSTDVTSRDNLLPPFADTSESGIQNLIKSKISREDLDNFLELKLDEDAIDDFRQLLELRGPLYAMAGDLGSLESNNQKRKYLFDLAIVILYEELLTFKQVRSMIESLGVLGAVAILEKMVVLEYGIFFLTKTPIVIPNADQRTESFNKVYIADNIINLYHSDLSRKSYKDEANIDSELRRIYDETLAQLSLTPQDILNLPFPSSFTYKSLVRVNGRSAEIEGENQELYSFYLNYNTYQETVGGSTTTYFDQISLRKYWAITSDGNPSETFGFYVKDNQRIYLTDVASRSYYTLLSNTYIENYKKINDFLKTLWANTLERTINY